MKGFLGAIILSFVMSFNAAADVDFDYNQFIRTYFDAWKGTQKPNATEEDLEHYLSFLTDDVGYQHLPYSNDDSRTPEGKSGLRKGMTYYLGTHNEYEATLTNQSYGHNVILIEFHTKSKGIHPDNNKLMVNESSSFEVLELDKGKISVIRHYSK